MSIYDVPSPQFTMVNELYAPFLTPSNFLFSDIISSVRMGWKWVFSRMPYGEAWRERRRMFMQYFHPGKTALYAGTQTEFIRKMLPQLLKDPENFLSITRQYVFLLPGGLNLKEYYH